MHLCTKANGLCKFTKGCRSYAKSNLILRKQFDVRRNARNDCKSLFSELQNSSINWDWSISERRTSYLKCKWAISERNHASANVKMISTIVRDVSAKKYPDLRRGIHIIYNKEDYFTMTFLPLMMLTCPLIGAAMC